MDGPPPTCQGELFKCLFTIKNKPFILLYLMYSDLKDLHVDVIYLMASSSKLNGKLQHIGNYVIINTKNSDISYYNIKSKSYFCCISAMSSSGCTF